MMQNSLRRYDLDWLRVLVFGLLIFYHAGMFFVPWGWHIKNNIVYDWIRWPMMFINQWRLPILFVISGMGTYYALGGRNSWQFARERFLRLFIPLLFGMFIIVPPQVFLERMAYNGMEENYFRFLMGSAFRGIYPEGNFSWHHLWFLPYLLIFSLMLVPLFSFIRKHPEGKAIKGIKRILALPLGIMILIVPLWLAEWFLQPLFPVTHALWNDWYTLVKYILLFFYGFMLMTLGEDFHKVTRENRRIYLITGVLGIALFIAMGYSTASDSLAIRSLLKVTGYWCMILSLFGYAGVYLNRNSRAIRYSTEAVYPFYILHQTITVGIGYLIMNKNWGFPLKASILVGGTFLLTWLIYEYSIRRTSWLRPLFGLKQTRYPLVRQ